MKRALLLRTRGLASRVFSLHNGEARFATADQEAEIVFVPSAGQSGLCRGRPENLGTVFFPSAFKTHLFMKNKHRWNAQNKNLTARQ